jgi:tetratricopeptide (TPR) repeat protein
VIARTSSFVFKDSGYDVRRICDLLGVEYLLQGSVRRDTGDLRISATLVDRNGFQLWQTTLERELGGIFALQDEIAEAVATSIVPQIVPHTASVRATGRLVEQVEIAKKAILATIEDDASRWHLDLAAAYAALGMWERAEYWQARAERMWPDEHLVRLSRVRIEVAAGRLEVSQAPARFRETLDEAGLEIVRIPRRLTHAYGELQALAGEYEGAIATLESLISPVTGNFSLNMALPEGNTPHALAWTWMQAGAQDRAGALLRPADEHFRRSQAEGRLRHFSEGLAYFARNTLLLGDVELALELLDQAVEAGWREYYVKIRDPRWALVDDEPRFKSIMARVKADIDQQRARMEQVDAEDNFTARLNAALVARESRVAIP